RRDAAWELYHENSKRGPGDPPAAPRPPPSTRGHGHLPELTTGAAAGPGPPGAIALDKLRLILAAGGRTDGAADPVLFVYAAAVAGLAPVLAVHDPSVPCLRRFRDDVRRADIDAALADGAPGAAAIVFLVADLEAATATAGERGYRDALLASGRRL